MKIIFMGTPQFAVDILKTLIKHHDVLLVVTQPDKRVGRKQVLEPSPVKELALSLNLDVFQPVKLSKDYEYLLTLDADLIVTAAYGQMLPKALLDHFKSINVHGSILPKYRGGAPIQYALFDGLIETGITIMWMAQKMDSGDIIKYAYTKIDKDDNFETLAKKLSDIGATALMEVLSQYEKQAFKIDSTPQNHLDATFAYNITRDLEFVDFTETSDVIINRLRGLMPSIGLSIKVNEHVLKIYELKQVSGIIDEVDPSTIIINNKQLFIKAADTFLEVIQIQAPGKKIMLVKDFLNGQKLFNSYESLTRKEDLNV